MSKRLMSIEWCEIVRARAKNKTNVTVSILFRSGILKRQELLYLTLVTGWVALIRPCTTCSLPYLVSQEITMRNIPMMALAAISLSACATTKREEVRNDIRSLEQRGDELRSAERDGSVKDVQKARKKLRHADRDLRAHQSELYRPGVEGAAIVGMKVGQSDPGNLRLVPDEYRPQYIDDQQSYYRYDGGQIYRIRVADRVITDVYPVLGR